MSGAGLTGRARRALDYSYCGDDNLEPCSLYPSILDRMGVKLDRFGEAEARLAGS